MRIAIIICKCEPGGGLAEVKNKNKTKPQDLIIKTNKKPKTPLIHVLPPVFETHKRVSLNLSTGTTVTACYQDSDLAQETGSSLTSLGVQYCWNMDVTNRCGKLILQWFKFVSTHRHRADLRVVPRVPSTRVCCWEWQSPICIFYSGAYGGVSLFQPVQSLKTRIVFAKLICMFVVWASSLKRKLKSGV